MSPKIPCNHNLVIGGSDSPRRSIYLYFLKFFEDIKSFLAILNSSNSNIV